MISTGTAAHPTTNKPLKPSKNCAPLAAKSGANMNKLLRIFLISMIAGLLITVGSYFVSRSEAWRCPFGAMCAVRYGGFTNEHGFPRPYLQSYTATLAGNSPNTFLRDEFTFDVFA